MTLFCLIGDLLKAMNYREDVQCLMCDAEVMTTALIAAFCFGGNWTHACRWLHTPQYIPRMLSKSRFNRRLHRIKPMFLLLFACLSEVWKELIEDCIYSINTFPIPVCDNIRILRAKIYRDEAYRGYIPSKRLEHPLQEAARLHCSPCVRKAQRVLSRPTFVTCSTTSVKGLKPLVV